MGHDNSDRHLVQSGLWLSLEEPIQRGNTPFSLIILFWFSGTVVPVIVGYDDDDDDDCV